MSQVAYINNRPYEYQNGETILNFVRRIKEKRNAIPTLCDAPNLEPFGSCRVCSVEVALAQDGPTRTVASCHTPVGAGQYIYTDSQKCSKTSKKYY